MTTEYKTIVIARYRTPMGKPTCSEHHPAGRTCQFLGAKRLGTVPVCMFGAQVELKNCGLEFQEPREDCPVWKD